MIVFYGTQSRPWLIQPEASVRFGSEVTNEQIHLANQWIRRPALNLTDLRHFSLPVLCHLYKEYLANQTNSTWEWDLNEVTIKDVVGALHLDGYVPPENVVELPLWFKTIMTIFLLVCMLFACFKSFKTIVAIIVSKFQCSRISVLVGTLAANDMLLVGCTALVEVASIKHNVEVWIPHKSSWFARHWLGNSFQYKSSQNYGQIGCHFLPFLQSLAALIGAVVLALIIVDRYVYVFGNKTSANGRRSCIAGWTVAAAYICSIGLAMPTFWLWRVYHFIIVDDIPDPDFGIDFCSVFPLCLSDLKLSTGRGSFFYVYHLALSAAIYGPLLLLFLGTFYLRIGRYLRISHVVQGFECQPIKHKKRISRSILGLVSVFFICRLPSTLLFILDVTQAIEATPTAVYINKSFVMLSVLSTCLSPRFYTRLDVEISDPVTKCFRSNSIDVRQSKSATGSRGSRRNKNETFDMGLNVL